MTKRILLFALISIVACLTTNKLKAQQPTVGGPMLSVEKKEHDFGTMKKGADATCTFVVKNTGDAPLILSKCQGSCGCTVPTCSTNPVMPGATTDVIVKYDSTRIGAFQKSVTIYWNSNDPNHATEVLTIRGTVEE
jgi:phage tail tube protein FII